jgi:hypothetical protein
MRSLVLLGTLVVLSVITVSIFVKYYYTRIVLKFQCQYTHT